MVSVERGHHSGTPDPQGAVATREDMNLRRWTAATSRLPAQQLGDHHEIVGHHGGTHEQFEMLGTLDQCALHAAPAKQHGDAAFDADTESLPLLERPALSSASRSGLRVPPDCGMQGRVTPAVWQV